MDALEEFARVVVEAEPIVRLAMRVMDDREPRRLARAIELAGVVLETDAERESGPAIRASGQPD